MLRRAFNRVAAFRSTTFLIVANLTFFQVISQMGSCWQTLRQKLIHLSSSYLLYVWVLPQNPTLLFLFFLTVVPRREPMSAPNIVWAFFISVKLMGFFWTCCHIPCPQNLPPDGRTTMFHADLAFYASRIYRFAKPCLFYSTVCTNVTSRFLPLGSQLW